MSYKKFKPLIALFLIFVFTFTLCFSNMVFAIDDGNQAVGEGTYHIKNYETDLYMNDLDWFSVVLNSFAGTSSYKWEFIYVSNGYYYIKNTGNGRYLTAPANNTEGSLIEQSSLSDSKASRQLWSIKPTYVGGGEYYIQAQSQESADLYVASSKSIGAYGYDLIQSSHEQYQYYNFWNLEKVNFATLIGINYTSSSSEDHMTVITTMESQFASNGWSTTALTPTSITSASVVSYMENSDAFVLFTHGAWNNSGSYAYLDEYGSNKLYTNDIYNYTTGEKADLSGCDVAVFAGCYTAYNTTYNLALASVHAGANYAVGFDSYTDCSIVKNWVQIFASRYSYGYSVTSSVTFANSQTSLDIAPDSVIIYAQGG